MEKRRKRKALGLALAAAQSPTTGRTVPEGRFLPVLACVDNGWDTVTVNGRRVKAAGVGKRALWGAQDADVTYESIRAASPEKGYVETRYTLLFSDALAEGKRVHCGPVRSLREASASLREEWQGALVYMSRLPYRYVGEAVERLRADSGRAFGAGSAELRAWSCRLKGVKAPGNLNVDITGIQGEVAADSNARPFLFTRDDDAYAGWPEAGSVTLDWGYAPYTARFAYDAGTGAYLRENAGVPFASYATPQDRMSGNQDALARLTFANVIVMRVKYAYETPLIPAAELVGEGSAEFFIAGRHASGSWKRERPDARTVFYDERGEELRLRPGKTYVAHFPTEGVIEK